MATTTAVDSKTFIRTYLEAVSGKDKPKELMEKYTTDEHLQEHAAVFEAAFPRYLVLAEDMIAEGDKVAVRARFQGVHKGEFMGIPATGKRVDLPCQIIYQIAGGKIVQHWASLDQLSLMKQLGVTQ
jgi:predicted ester cyclase